MEVGEWSDAEEGENDGELLSSHSRTEGRGVAARDEDACKV